MCKAISHIGEEERTQNNCHLIKTENEFGKTSSISGKFSVDFIGNKTTCLNKLYYQIKQSWVGKGASGSRVDITNFSLR